MTEFIKICYYSIMLKLRKIIIVCFISFFLIQLDTAFSTFISSDINIDVKANRTSAVYLCGDQAVFLITLRMNRRPLKAGKIRVKLSLDGLKRIKDEEIELINTSYPLKITGTLDKPGFLRCIVEYTRDNNVYRGYGAAGFEPERIRALSIKPNDFDEFWAQGRTELTKIPLNIKLTKLPDYSNSGYKCYKISFANINGTRMYGYLNVPSRKHALHPALVKLSGASIVDPKKPVQSDKMLTLNMSVHDYDVGLSRKAYKEFEAKYKELSPIGKGSYVYIGAPERKYYFFYRVILGLDRAINYIASRKDFNGKHLVIQGGSQGGFLALALAGLNQKITAVVAGEPGYCDHAGYLGGRLPGAPKLLLSAPDDQREKWLKMSAYYDTVNFVDKITCPVLISVGFIDLACSPSSVYAAYNNISAQKNIFQMPFSGHSDKLFLPMQKRWIELRLGLR